MKKISSHNSILKKKQAIAISDKFRKDSPVDELFKIREVKTALYITERSDDFKLIKYKGQRLWTNNAIKHYLINGIKGLRHEHAIPRKLIETEILKNEDKSAEYIFTVLDNLLHAVIVTKEESKIIDSDKKLRACLPDNVNFKISNETNYILSRYIASNIEVYYIDSGDPKNYNEKIKLV